MWHDRQNCGLEVYIPEKAPSNAAKKKKAPKTAATRSTPNRNRAHRPGNSTGRTSCADSLGGSAGD
jgi:hypothetical protein